MLDELKKEVYDANCRLVAAGLVAWTFGNASGVSRAEKAMVIKPSGVDYKSMKPGDMVVVSLDDGSVLDGALRPSSDSPTHIELYRAFASAGGVAHTHSVYATAWAQGGRDIPVFGTTHADHFHGPIPCTRAMVDEEVLTNYEANTGKVIAETFEGLDPLSVPAVLVANHGPFTWGASPAAAAVNAAVLEHIAMLAARTVQIAPDAKPISRYLLDKHYGRKHGPGSYYGQR
jgi:L-ribulose-5-phosphate 4-epimerase